jgi:GxxExxY protein
MSIKQIPPRPEVEECAIHRHAVALHELQPVARHLPLTAGVLIRSPVAERVIGCAIEVHRAIGPGLLESAYGLCLSHELQLQGLSFARDVAVPVVYKEVRLDRVYRADFVIENTLLVEIKSVEQLMALHQSQVLTYLKLLDLHHGLLINFNARRLVDGLRSLLR